MIRETLALQIDLMRFDASKRRDIIKLLEKLEKELVADLAKGNLTDWGKARVNALLKQARETIAEYYKRAQGDMLAATEGALSVAANASRAALANYLPIGIEPSLPTASMLSSIAGDVIINGATQADWWERQSADTAWRFAAAVRQGITAGETNQQIIDRVVGKSGFPGVMEVSRRNAATLVQTSVQSVANEARMAVFKANSDVISKLTWVTALDQLVCEQCAARADLSWTLDGEPIGHNIPFENPPIHFNDRCVLVPETKTWKELGIDAPEMPEGMRASREGPVRRSMTFREWLENRTPAQQDEQLGKGRAELFRDGKITLNDLVNGRGNPLTLEQLRARYE